MKKNFICDENSNLFCGPIILTPEIFFDNRGYFLEAWNKNNFASSIEPRVEFVQDNESFSKRGTIRGLHFQLNPYPQGKLVRVIKGEIYGAIILWFVGCKEQVVIKKAPSTISEGSTEMQSDYSIGVKGNCGMCKTTIEKAVKALDFVLEAEWGIQSKILDVRFNNPSNFDINELNTAITESGYETMNTTANQASYDALPMCCKYDRNMQVYSTKSD